jgi:hypothetical protein
MTTSAGVNAQRNSMKQLLAMEGALQTHQTPLLPQILVLRLSKHIPTPTWHHHAVVK